MNNEGYGEERVLFVCKFWYNVIDWIIFIIENKCFSFFIMIILFSLFDKYIEVNNFLLDFVEFWYINSW